MTTIRCLIALLACTAACGLSQRAEHDAGVDALPLPLPRPRDAAPVDARLRPGLEITPVTHDFGRLTVGAISPAQTFAIRNTGNTAIAAPAVSLEQAESYVVSDDACRGDLEPGASCAVQLAFHPVIAGDHAALLTATSGDLVASSGVTALAESTLRVTRAGDGDATIRGDGIDCGTTCTATVSQPSVTLTATAAGGTRLTGWSLPACRASTVCTVPMDAADKSITATVERVPLRLTVEVSPMRGGKVTATGIDCGGGGDDCTETFPGATTVALTEQAVDGYVFSHWTSCDRYERSTCVIDLWSDRTVTARFDAIHPLTLRVSESEPGPQAAVQVTPAQQGCVAPDTCTYRYRSPTEVTLEAVPASSRCATVEWSGACLAPVFDVCRLRMNGPKEVNVHFRRTRGPGCP
jgi:hypothetical protein